MGFNSGFKGLNKKFCSSQMCSLNVTDSVLVLSSCRFVVAAYVQVTSGHITGHNAYCGTHCTHLLGYEM